MSRFNKVPSSKLTNALKRVANFLQVHINLIKKGCAGYRVDVAIIAILSMLAAALSGAAFGLLGFFARLLSQSEAAIELPVIGLVLDRDQITLLLAGGLLMLFVGAALMSYVASVKARRLARAYQMLSASQAMGSAQRNVGLRPGWNKLLVRYLVVRDSLHSGKALETLIRMLEPAAYLICGLLIMLSIHPVGALSGIVLLLTLVPVLYLVGSKIQGNSRAYFQRAMADHGGLISAKLNELDTSSFPAQAAAPSFAHSYREDDKTIHFYDGYDSMQLAPAQTSVVVSIFAGIAIAIVVMVFSKLAANGIAEWDDVIVFVGGYLLLLRSCQHLGGHLAALHRFYPQMIEYETEMRPLTVVEDGNFSAKNALLEDKPGQLIHIVTANKLNRETIGEIVSHLLQSPSQCPDYSNIGFVLDGFLTKEELAIKTLSSVLTKHRDDPLAGQLLEDLELPELFAAGDEGDCGRIWRGSSSEQRHELALFMLLVGRPIIAFVSAKFMGNISKPRRQRLWHRNLSTYIVAVSSKSYQSLSDQVSVCVIDEQGVKFRNDEESIKSYLAKHRLNERAEHDQSDNLDIGLIE